MKMREEKNEFKWDDIPYHPIVEDEDYILNVNFISTAIRSKKIFGVFGDYDADGVTSTAIFTETLEKFGAKVVQPVLNNIRFGFGININAINYLVNLGAEVIVIFDSGTGFGVGDFEALDEYANSNIQFVIVDHHVPKDLSQMKNRNVHIINPHLVPGADRDFGNGLRASSLSLLVARSIFLDMQGTCNELFIRRLVAMAAIGGKADAIQPRESSLHDFLLAKSADAAALAVLPSFKLLMTEHQMSTPFADDDWYYISLVYGIGKFNEEGSSLGCYYLIKSKTENSAHKTLVRVLKEADETIAAVANATAAARDNTSSIEDTGLHFALLNKDEMPEAFLGLSGTVAANLSRDLNGEPVFVLIETNRSYYKGSYRSYNNVADWDGDALLSRIIEKIGADNLNGGGHPAAGGFRLNKKSFTTFVRLLRECGSVEAEKEVESK